MTLRTAAFALIGLATVVLLWLGQPGLPTEASAITAVDGGSGHSCALTAEGGLRCWGFRSRGRLGDGMEEDGVAVPPVDVLGLTSNVTTFSVGGISTCAVTAGGGVKCWGYNNNGQLGDGTTTDRFVPVDVIGLTSGIVSVAVGASHTCAVAASGGVKCWGRNPNGLLGFGDRALVGRTTLPGDVLGLDTDVNAVGVGDSFSCALTVMGGVKCWGIDYDGQLGDGSTCELPEQPQCVPCALPEQPQCDDQYSTVPVDVVGLTSGVRSIAIGSSHACALTEAAEVRCWGGGTNGQLGALPWPDCAGVDTACSTAPVVIGGLEDGVTAIAAGNNHTCAVMVSGGLRCWGRNANGQLGDGTATNSGRPVEVSGLSDIVGVGAGDAHTCAVRTSGEVVCWGYNQVGKLGDGTTTDRTAPATVIGSKPPVVRLVPRNGKVMAGETVVIDVFALATTPFASYEFHLGFDPLALSFVSLDEGGEALADAGRHPLCGGPDENDLLSGIVSYFCASTGDSAGPSGDVLLATVSFEVKCGGSSSDLDFVPVGKDGSVPAVSLGDSIGEGISVNYEGASLTVNSSAECSSPSPIPALTATPLPTNTPKPTATAIIGDASCDGSVNPLDAALILQHSAGMILFLPCPEGGDANGDGVTNPLDAALVLQFSAGLIGALPP